MKERERLYAPGAKRAARRVRLAALRELLPIRRRHGRRRRCQSSLRSVRSFFLLLSFLPLFFCSVLFGERLATTERERERERERCSLQRDKSSRRAEGVPPGAPSKKRVTERERGRKFFFLSHILACCFFLLNRCPISFVVRLRASLFARTSSLSEREELPRARHHCLSLTL